MRLHVALDQLVHGETVHVEHGPGHPQVAQHDPEPQGLGLLGVEEHGARRRFERLHLGDVRVSVKNSCGATTRLHTPGWSRWQLVLDDRVGNAEIVETTAEKVGDLPHVQVAVRAHVYEHAEAGHRASDLIATARS